MRWPWSKRHVPPAIPPSPYHAPVSIRETAKQEPGIEAKEVKPPPGMTETGVFKAWVRGERPDDTQ